VDAAGAGEPAGVGEVLTRESERGDWTAEIDLAGIGDQRPGGRAASEVQNAVGGDGESVGAEAQVESRPNGDEGAERAGGPGDAAALAEDAAGGDSAAGDVEGAAGVEVDQGRARGGEGAAGVDVDDAGAGGAGGVADGEAAGGSPGAVQVDGAGAADRPDVGGSGIGDHPAGLDGEGSSAARVADVEHGDRPGSVGHGGGPG